ncbi:MAG: calcium-translocating P-type ATPase, PMCA-type [Deltaproteobacteria bacterium]|nr:calcium-translocating P-type ATPase, PMCA-type [Deltaproteobacteria bacterium]
MTQDLPKGLTSAGVAESRRQFGTNRVERPAGRTISRIFRDALSEKTLLILIGAAVLALSVELLRGWVVEGYDPHFVDGVAILVAVLIASSVTTVNEARAAKKFRSLEELERDHPVRVFRDGEPSSVPSGELVVGDLVALDLGDRVPADGELVEGIGLSIDQSALTGESLPIEKSGADRALLGSTVVRSGSGLMRISAVGVHSEMGKQMQRLLEAAPGRTPLEERLARLADRMGGFGVASAVLTFLALLASEVLRGGLELAFDLETGSHVLELAIVAVTVLVVAVPEGLPLAVTISLAYSVVRMAKDRALVKRLAACETMGAATVVCTDKTGTLTENRMTARSVWSPEHGEIDASAFATAPASLLAAFSEIAHLDSTVLLRHEGAAIEALGNPTEAALLMLAERAGPSRPALVLSRVGFTSERKRMSTMIRDESGRHRILTKGAPEVVMERCRFDSAERRAEARSVFEAMAAKGERTLALAFRELSEAERGVAPEELERDLELVAIVSIRDPLRAEVKEAVTRARSAGVEVKILTGDHRAIAESIARELELLGPGDVIMEGEELRALDDEALDAAIPRLRVLARSTPADKLRLVERLSSSGEVVAVTGDGTNDAAALEAADVGFAMGIRGTAVARDAADVILLDDDFSTLVKAIAWGRTIFENVQKFLMFQLTVNVVAVATAFLAAVLGFGVPLNTVQLLWVNLIMDTLAALALATEPPSLRALERPPHGRVEPLVGRTMVFQIAMMGAFMVALLLIAMETSWFVPESVARPEKVTFVFNAFVLMQVANELNARSPRLDRGIFEGLARSPTFLAVIAGTIALQILIVQLGGRVFKTVPISLDLWARSLAAGALVLLFGIVVRAIGRRVFAPSVASAAS